MSKFISIIKDYFIPRGNSKINLNPNYSGLIVGDGKVLINWDEIKEFREDYWLGRLDFFNKFQMQDIIITTSGNYYYSRILPGSVREAIIGKANLKLKGVSFWTSQKVYTKQIYS